MSTFNITHQDGAPIGENTFGLTAEECLAFLESHSEPYMYSVGEWDEQTEERIEQLNGEEWLRQRGKHVEEVTL